MDLFHFYNKDNLPKDKSRYSHYGWEENGTVAWNSMLLGYKYGLDALFEKYENSKGDYAKLDTLVYPICFLSRQIIELSLKYLFFKYSNTTDEEKKDYLNINHNLYDEWMRLKPILSKEKKKITTNVSIGGIENYVLQMNAFDQTSMKMRYPVDKSLKATNDKAQWLDIYDLYEGINNYYDLVMQLVYDFDRMMSIDDNKDELVTFVKQYKQKRNLINNFLNILSKVNEKGNIKDHKGFDINDILMPDVYDKAFKEYDKFDDDTKIIIECLYYSGRAVHDEEVNLPKSNGSKILCVTTLCVRQMRSDHTEFGKELQDWQTNVYGKMASSIIANCREAMKYLDSFSITA